MAQILKEDLKEKILEAASKEILAKGIEKASMRCIARSANMTVGNLYRYFESKDMLAKAIYSPFLDDLNAMLSKYTDDKISLFKNDFVLSEINMTALIDNITNELIDLYSVHKHGMKIIMQNKQLGQDLINWLGILLKNLSENPTDDIYYEMLSISIFEGLSYLFSKELDEKVLKSMFRKYMLQTVLTIE